MSDTGLVVIAVIVAGVSAAIYLTIRYVADAIAEARQDAAEAWKEVLGERTARAKAEADALRLRALYENPLPLPPPSLDVHSRATAQNAMEGVCATAPVSKDTLRAILRANGIAAKDFDAADAVDIDDPTRP